MKNKEKKKEQTQRPKKEIKEIPSEGHPFVFEEDKELIEELARKSSYIRSLFST